MTEKRPPLTLSELIAKLEEFHPDHEIVFDFGGLRPTDFDSYRGYYQDLALGYSELGDKVTVGQLLASAKLCLTETFEGYKGGTYRMGKGTPVWAAVYGRSTGTAIVDVTFEDYIAVIHTSYHG